MHPDVILQLPDSSGTQARHEEARKTGKMSERLYDQEWHHLATARLTYVA